MPELPEVEVVRQGIDPFVSQQCLTGAVVRQPQLRWPVTKNLHQILVNQQVLKTDRRGKYLLLRCTDGTLLIHLGMSGVLSWLPGRPDDHPLKKHDHIDLLFGKGLLRLNDPRRFGAVLWVDSPRLENHPLLTHLGLEPWDPFLTPQRLYQLSRGRQLPIKQALLAGHWVVGVGNIYASESLFRSGIDPRRAAGRISLQRYDKLLNAIRQILQAAIEQGGSTLKDFRGHGGETGQFQTAHQVYDRAGMPCTQCSTPIRVLVQSGRSTYYCLQCQR